MRILSAAAVMLLLTAPAYAQMMPNVNLMPEVKTLSPEEKEQEAVRDKALAWVPNAMLFLDGTSAAPDNFEGADVGVDDTGSDEQADGEPDHGSNDIGDEADADDEPADEDQYAHADG